MNSTALASRSSLTPSSSLRGVRLQAAVIRALLDELEDRTSTEAEPGRVDQLADELGRLGRAILRASVELSHDVPPR